MVSRRSAVMAGFSGRKAMAASWGAAPARERRLRRTGPVSSPAVARLRHLPGTFYPPRENIRRGPTHLPDDLDMPAELSERLQASDAALATRVACGDPSALTPLY